MSRGIGEVIQFYGGFSNQHFLVKPGGSLYVVGSSTTPLINLSGADNRSFVLDSPGSYDLRNNNNTSAGRVLEYANNTQIFQIKNADIDLWGTTKAIMGPSTETYSLVGELRAYGAGVGTVTSTEPALAASFLDTKYRRIAGMNANPELEMNPITDADYTYKSKVRIGYTPDGTFNPDNSVNLVPVYAAAGQAEVTYTNTYNESKIALTNTVGEAIVTESQFQKTGTKVTATAKHGPWFSDEVSGVTVIDVTPPEPAVVGNPIELSPVSKKLYGTGEPGAVVTMTVNDVPNMDLDTTVAADGKWSVDLPKGLLKQDDVIQIFLRDTSGLAEVSFGTLNVLDFKTIVGVTEEDMTTGLVVSDTRGNRTPWKVSAQVVQEMTGETSNDVLSNALKYVYKGQT